MEGDCGILPAEAARLKVLADYEIMDTEPEEAFDRLTALAAALFDVPIALVSLVDSERQWFKARHGLGFAQTPRSWSFCAHALALNDGQALIVEDAATDPRFRANPMVVGAPGIRFYTGAVLTGEGGHNLGALCVIDTKPRAAPSAGDLGRLNMLAQMVVDELELRRITRLYQDRAQQLELAQKALADERELLEVTLLSIADGVVTTDEEGRIRAINPAAESMLGWRGGEARGKSFADVVQLFDQRSGAPIRDPSRPGTKIARGAVAHEALLRPRGAAGDRPIQYSVSPIRDSHERSLGVVMVMQDLSEIRALAQHMSHLAQHDVLTGLPNRLLFQDRVRQACQAGVRNRNGFAIAYMDLDGFKEVNDTMGHAAGDELLQLLARRMTSALRASDTVCRLGGDEFVLLLPDLVLPHDAERIAGELVAMASRPFELGGRRAEITASVGVALFPVHGRDPDTLMRRADDAMYAAKRGGKNQFRLFIRPGPDDGGYRSDVYPE